MNTNARHYGILDGFPSDVVAVSAHGKLTRADYQDVLIPKVQDVVKREGKVKLLVIFGPEFEGFSAGAAWDDAAFGLLHLGDFASLAVVSDIAWVRLGVATFAPFIRCPVALFHNDELDKARTWISEWRHEAAPPREAAVDHKMPTREDKM